MNVDVDAKQYCEYIIGFNILIISIATLYMYI